ncbi:hypothetical protein F2P81_008491 [Scophthalmus maximus]|uniref:Arf-GAP with Rho-GAP domain ANK repeat and PH domain-containing protein 3 n=1 Tax=Scophthalmus maximus TaxID=52904 RepID=A0A6A4SYE2_SCOMX|nr:hypothetical protein F2P81_008491 [Scophthalmus maximus]
MSCLRFCVDTFILKRLTGSCDGGNWCDLMLLLDPSGVSSVLNSLTPAPGPDRDRTLHRPRPGPRPGPGPGPDQRCVVEATLRDSVGLYRTLPDSVGLSGTLSDSLRLCRTLSDSLRLCRTLSDSLGLSRTLPDSLRLSRTLSDSLRLSRTLSDSLGLSKTLSDSVGLSKTLSDSPGLSRTLSDSLGLSRTLSDSLRLCRSLSDSLGVSRTLSDSPGLSRTLSDSPGLCRTLSDSLGLSRTLSDSLGLSRTLSDSLRLCRTLSDSVGLSRTLSDSVGLCRTLSDPVVQGSSVLLQVVGSNPGEDVNQQRPGPGSGPRFSWFQEQNHISYMIMWYLDTFRRAALLLARDFTHLDHDALVSLGVTATGHRKRILRLVSHVQRTEVQRANQKVATDLPRDRCQSVSDVSSSERGRGAAVLRGTTGPVHFEAFRNSSTPNLAAMLTNSESSSSKAAVKPVPKPRTVFNRRRTAPIHYCSVPDPAPPPPRRLSQESICFTLLEGSTSGDTPIPGNASTSDLTPSRRQGPVERTRPSRSSSLSDPGGLLPPVPPRLNHAAPPSMFQESPPSSSSSSSPLRTEQSQTSCPMSMDSSRLSGSSPSSSPRGGGIQMVSNEIYWGTSPGSTAPSGGASYSSQQPAPPTPPRKTPERNRSHKFSWTRRRSQALHSGDSQGYSTVGEAPPAPHCLSLPLHSFPSEADEDLTISPYASYTSLTERAPPIISGWLDKLSPQGNYVFQKRFVKFDGKNLMYFGSEKDVYPKGVIPLAAIQMARPSKDSKFEIVTSQRIFVFRAENEVLRRRWVSTLQEHVRDQLVFGRRRFGPGAHCQRHGVLELKGTKSRVYTAINTDQIWIHKNEQCFHNGIGVTVVDARGATIRDGKHKSFDLITPYKTFSFTAETDREKRDWMEALQEAIAETLSDYEVAEKIWSNRSNRACADCKALNPDWASINLCVVICKNCAGQHRGLGTMVSKVQSLKLDTSVWSNEIVQLFIMLGNDRANDFWAARLSQWEELDCDAPPEQRREFISQKYREGRYRLPHPAFSRHEDLLKVLCSAVSEQTLLKTVTQIFSEAESARLANDLDGGQRHHQLLDPCTTSDPGVYDEIMQPVLHSGYLYKSGSVSRGTLSRKTREDFQKFWCSVDRSLLLYESERSADPCMQISVRDIVCLGVTRPDSSNNNNNNGFIDRFRYTFELYLTSEKLHQFGLETVDALHSWTRAIGKAATPLSCHCLLTREFERVGLLRYRAMLDPQQWKEAYFVLQKSNLFICPRNDGAAEDIINLNRLQEISIASENENHEKKDILVLVEKGRTLHLQGVGRTDFSLWYSDIQRAAGGKGNTLREQQLSRNDIPIIVDSCMAFITQYGLGHEGIYRKNGAKSRIKLLMEEFRKDARSVKLRIGDHFIEDVTDVLKRFFREIDDPIFMADLHPLWQGAAKTPQKSQRLDRYKEIIRSLPRVNRTTLAALVSHLYRVQKCADLNQMCTKNLSLLFAPSLFQTDGKGEHEVKIMEDLIDNFLYVFDIDEEHQTQIELEISLITSWKDTQLSQAGDLIIEVYLEMKIPDCCITLKVSPTMCAEELTNQVLYMRNVPAVDKDVWMTFEAIEDGQLERPLHPKERVLEQALQWCKMADPSSAYLVVKRVPKGEGINILTCTLISRLIVI